MGLQGEFWEVNAWNLANQAIFHKPLHRSLQFANAESRCDGVVAEFVRVAVQLLGQ